jgi:hypothetical protein
LRKPHRMTRAADRRVRSSRAERRGRCAASAVCDLRLRFVPVRGTLFAIDARSGYRQPNDGYNPAIRRVAAGIVSGHRGNDLVEAGVTGGRRDSVASRQVVSTSKITPTHRPERRWVDAQPRCCRSGSDSDGLPLRHAPWWPISARKTSSWAVWPMAGVDVSRTASWVACGFLPRRAVDPHAQAESAANGNNAHGGIRRHCPQIRRVKPERSVARSRSSMSPATGETTGNVMQRHRVIGRLHRRDASHFHIGACDLLQFVAIRIRRDAGKDPAADGRAPVAATH